MARFILSLDQGTTSSRSILFDENGVAVATSQYEFRQYFPESGWVEHDAVEIWETQLKTMLEVMEKVGVTEKDVAGIGITNQRETVLLWDRRTGEPVANAIVWQDRRTADLCRQMRDAGLEPAVSALTGLRLDPYFSASKVQWLLDHVEGARERAEAGELCMGTIDSWLVYKLTEGKVHVTDATNASRTLLCNIHTGEWDDILLGKFGVPRGVLPRIVDCTEVVGEWRGVPISGMAGDQQAALFGQACYAPGMAKNTYGTGCFMLLHTGDRVVRSQNQLLSTIALQRGGKREYCLEGSVFIAGSLFQWLRDGLQLFDTVQEFDALAQSVPDSGGVVIVPALSGLGAPHWDPFARGLITGLSRGTTKAHICRAAIEAVSFQSVELLECMQGDASREISELRVDGGATASDLLMQVQADLMGCDLVRPEITETTAFGAAALAGLGVGFWESREALAAAWREEKRFSPQKGSSWRKGRRAEWDKAVRMAMSESGM
ncbi:glycerol kinase GlpK [Rubritalea tangerina]|uniref:glycerol kinase GlpK n=1 Tax=Rubritalea tangerina TaxID=430798 RepID=UPI00361985E0